MKKETNTTKPPRKFYAMSWSHGRAVCATTGGRYGASYFSFPSPAERDEWAEGGGDFTSSTGWREAVKASDSELRSYIYAHNHTPDSSGGFYRTDPFSTDGKPNR